jgi:hypothetical protein
MTEATRVPYSNHYDKRRRKNDESRRQSPRQISKHQALEDQSFSVLSFWCRGGSDHFWNIRTSNNPSIIWMAVHLRSRLDRANFYRGHERPVCLVYPGLRYQKWQGRLAN